MTGGGWENSLECSDLWNNLATKDFQGSQLMRIRHIDNDMLDTSTGQLAAQTDDIADAHSAGSKIDLVQARFLDLRKMLEKYSIFWERNTESCWLH